MKNFDPHLFFNPVWTIKFDPPPKKISTPHLHFDNSITALMSYCLLLMQRSWRPFYQNFVVGNCTSHFKRAVCISCRPHVDVHRGEGGRAHVDACGQRGQKPDFLWTS